ncbi:MAG: PH domain-containing protein [Chloroflexota bacterium]
MQKAKTKEKRAIFEHYLLPDEELLWSGKPASGSIFSAQDIFLIPFSLLWGGFALFWTSSTAGMGAPPFFLLFGTLFVVIGQYLIWGRFVHKYWVRRGTTYAITDKRVFVLNQAFGANLTTYQIDKLDTVILKRRAVLFEESSLLSSKRNGWATWSGDMHAGLYGLSDAERVFGILQSIIHEKQKRG